MSRLLITCPEVAELASDALAGRLSGWLGLQVKLHLMRCRGCRRYTEQIRLVAETARDIALVVEEDADSVLAAIRSRLETPTP